MTKFYWILLVQSSIICNVYWCFFLEKKIGLNKCPKGDITSHENWEGKKQIACTWIEKIWLKTYVSRQMRRDFICEHRGTTERTNKWEAFMFVKKKMFKWCFLTNETKLKSTIISQPIPTNWWHLHWPYLRQTNVYNFLVMNAERNKIVHPRLPSNIWNQRTDQTFFSLAKYMLKCTRQ